MSETIYVNGTAHSVPTAGDTGYGDALAAFLVALCNETAGVLTFGATAGAGGATVYAVPGNGAAGATEIKMRMPVEGKLGPLRLRSTSVPTTQSVIATVRINGADTGITATLTTSDTSALSTLTEGVEAGDDVSIKLTQSAGAGCANLVCTLAFSGGS